MHGFLRHVSSGRNYATGQIGTLTDFLAFHAKGDPKFVDGHVRMDLDFHLRGVNSGFDKTLSTPSLASKPVMIGESDPEGCAACLRPRNGYRNGTMYSSYTAATRWRLVGAGGWRWRPVAAFVVSAVGVSHRCRAAGSDVRSERWTAIPFGNQ